MIKNVLISGGAGFIGSGIALRLASQGYAVTVLDNLSKQIHGENPSESFLYQKIKNKINFIEGDVRIKADWEKALKGQEAIIHLAAETGTGQSMYQIYKYCEVNTGGTSLLLNILANEKHSIKKIIIASSRAIYGEGRYYCQNHGEVYPSSRREGDLENGIFDCRCPLCDKRLELLATHEESKIDPQSIYAVSKYNQEQLCLVAGKALKIPVVAFRYQNVYGPGQSLSNPYTGILSIFSTQIKNNNSINIFEDGLESRDFVYIDDVIDATIEGLENEKANYNYYNVGSGTPTTVKEIAETLIRLYDTKVEINISGNFRLGDIRHNYADLTKIKNDLQFFPKFQFNTAIKSFVNWVNGQNINNDLYLNSILELKERGLYK